MVCKIHTEIPVAWKAGQWDKYSSGEGIKEIFVKLRWSDACSVGDEKLGEQHKKWMEF